jgi:hypothetical protein
MQEKWRRVRVPEKNDKGDLQRLPPLLTVLAGGDNHRYLQKKKHNKQSILIFFSPFRICSRVCFFCNGLLFFPLPVERLGGCRGSCSGSQGVDGLQPCWKQQRLGLWPAAG